MGKLIRTAIEIPLLGGSKDIEIRVTHDWVWISDGGSNNILGKYLFFSESREGLIEIALKEIQDHGFHRAKVPAGQPLGKDYVLCLYWKDDSRKNELAERNKNIYKVRYRYWKSDADTYAGKYSREHRERMRQL